MRSPRSSTTSVVFSSFALVALFAIACSGAEDVASPPADSSSEAGGDDGAKPPLAPALFDCTALGRTPPPPPAGAACARDPRCKARFVAGHRGAGGHLGRIAPEDSLAAYRAAYAMGLELVETDPRPTADGAIVNVHDTTVDRTTDGTGEVAQMTLAQVKALRLKSESFVGDFSCERVPTLEEILAQSRGRAIVLIDANKTDRVEAMVEAVRKTDTLEWAVFDTDDTAKIDEALRLEPRLMIQVRAQSEDVVAPLLAKYASHPPLFVEISSRVFPAGAPAVHAAGLRVFVDSFGTDFGVQSGAVDRGEYLGIFERGADAVQSDLPDEVTLALGRTVPAR